jgi:uncharacterized protein YkwD
MRRSLLSIGLSSLIVFSVASLFPLVASASSATSDVVDQVNAIRIQHGLAPLVTRPQLTSAAQSFAIVLATRRFFSHIGLDGSTPVSRDEAAGYRAWTILEENLAAGQESAAAVVNSWMQSPAHRADILSPKVTDTGVGHYYVAGSPFGHYWVQEFGAQAAIAPPVSASVPVAVTASPVAVTVAEANTASPVPAPRMTAMASDAASPADDTDEAPSFVSRVVREVDSLNLYEKVYEFLGLQ